MTQVLRPNAAMLPGCMAALKRGWSPDNLRPEATKRKHFAWIAKDAEGFLASLDDPRAEGPPVTLPDGSVVPRLPSHSMWVWQDGFCGRVGFRWQPGTEDLPPHVSGHIGYAIVPWRRNEGHATAALRAVLQVARARGLARVSVETDPANTPSRRVVEKCGGKREGTVEQAAALGGGLAERWWIAVPGP